VHLTTHGLFFEPDDRSAPITKATFQLMRTCPVGVNADGTLVDAAEALSTAVSIVWQSAMLTQMKPEGQPGPYYDVIVDGPSSLPPQGTPRGAGETRKLAMAKLTELRSSGAAAVSWMASSAEASGPFPTKTPLAGRTVHGLRFGRGGAKTVLTRVHSLFRMAHDSKGAAAPSEKWVLEIESFLKREWEGPIDTSLFSSSSETLLFPSPFLVFVVDGVSTRRCRLGLTDQGMYIQPTAVDSPSGSPPPPSIPFSRITQIWRRRRVMREVGLEVLMTSAIVGSTSASSMTASFAEGVLLEFLSVRDRETALEAIHAHVPPDTVMGAVLPMSDASGSKGSIPSDASDSVIVSKLRQVGFFDEGLARRLIAWTRQWQEMALSSYDYLACLNAVAGRSLRDLSQYPVFPWVLCDYSSSTLDLSDPKVFRDISKPIGALNQERLDRLIERMTHMPDGPGESASFLYGTHYSTPGYVMFFRVREAPDAHIRLQSGKFDKADRMFISIADTWSGVLNNSADFKELIPEFFSGNGKFLRNAQGLDLGLTQTGKPVGDVVLPPWASSPREFVRKHRAALESDHVSRCIHAWIDLIFGFKQRGALAKE
jgi:hypothetical protein